MPQAHFFSKKKGAWGIQFWHPYSETFPYLSMSIYIYLQLSIFIYTYRYLAISTMSIYRFLYLSVSICIYLYLSISICMYLYLSISIYIYLYLSISIYIYLYLSIPIYIYLYLYTYIMIFSTYRMHIIYVRFGTGFPLKKEIQAQWTFYPITYYQDLCCGNPQTFFPIFPNLGTGKELKHNLFFGECYDPQSFKSPDHIARW